MSFFAAQGFVQLVLGLGVLAVCAFSLVDALRHPPQAYAVAGKLTKNKWLAILGVATLVAFAALTSLGLLVICLVAGGVYLADVRPALRAVGGGPRGGNSSSSGPYGGW